MSERKYRQRGYQDEPKERQKREGPPKEQAPRAPGRPLQDASGPRTPNLMPSHEVFKCARCGNKLAVPVAEDARCSRCGVDLHSCIQCASFDTSARFECTQPTEGARVAQGRAQYLHVLLARARPSSARPARPARRAPARPSTICSSSRSEYGGQARLVPWLWSRLRARLATPESQIPTPQSLQVT